MRNFTWIFMHYFKKNILCPANLLVIGLPLVFIFAFDMLDNYISDFLNIRTYLLYGITMPIVLGFQFFCADLTSDWLHHDMKGPTRSRLLVSPVAPWVFYMAVMAAGWLFSVLYGSIVVAVTAVAFGVEWGNYGWVLVVMLALSFITQMVGVLIFRNTKTEKSGTRVSYVFGEVMLGITILPITIGNATDLSAPVVAIFNHSPVSVGMGIIANDNRLYNLAVLFGMAAVMAVIAFIIGRRGETER